MRQGYFHIKEMDGVHHHTLPDRPRLRLFDRTLAGLCLSARVPESLWWASLTFRSKAVTLIVGRTPTDPNVCFIIWLTLSESSGEVTRLLRPMTRRDHPMAADYTPKQGQFLAFIYYYTKIHRIPPAETDMQRFFRISPPAVHEMVKTLDSRGFITREPGKPRTIRVLLPRDELPDLE